MPADSPPTPPPTSACMRIRRGSSTPATPLTKTPCAPWLRWLVSAPQIAHEIDSLDLVEDLIVAGYGVGLLPIGRPTHPAVTVLPLSDPKVVLTAYAVTRRGRSTWPPLRVVLDRLTPATGRAVAETGLAAADRREVRRPCAAGRRVGGYPSTTGRHRSGTACAPACPDCSAGTASASHSCAALADGAGPAMLAAGAFEPGAAGPVGGRINR